ncbi:nitroreductase family deazaflavin-dependent oxidoreductase [Mycobacterium sp.]|uniref:nitroreductase family deazaflavin-dependent oxidoreductase n=1 Tax=Mycobacterium sp. TaxID=1785 RepID=UPI0025E1E7B3|nr:nitroreductase family deazaflavin-dependent oxidoreductase [Mycobacterium sp.]
MKYSEQPTTQTSIHPQSAKEINMAESASERIKFDPTSKYSLRALGPFMHAHTWVYRASRGRLGRRFPGLVAPMLVLHHVGARSGRHLDSALGYMERGEDIVIVASKAGQDTNPAWVYNLRANPEVDIQIGPKRRRVHAREVQGEERERLWAELIAFNPIWARYQERTARQIPLILLEPRT